MRFSPGEEGNDPEFVAQLVAGQDLYVDDAFGAAHRAHASIVGPPSLLPSAAGRVLAREVEVLDRLLDGARHPFVAVLGGSKVSDKLGVIEALLERVDTLLVGGGMCFTFLAAQGHSVGASLLEKDRIDDCRRLLASGHKILLPTDLTVLSPGGTFGPGQEPTGQVRQVHADVPDGWTGLDIGPGTGGRVRRRDPRRGNRLLERPDGGLRGPPLRRRDPHGGRGRGRVAGFHHRRGRRQRRRPGRAGAERQGGSRLDGRGRIARVPGTG